MLMKDRRKTGHSSDRARQYSVHDRASKLASELCFRGQKREGNVEVQCRSPESVSAFTYPSVVKAVVRV